MVSTIRIYIVPRIDRPATRRYHWSLAGTSRQEQPEGSASGPANDDDWSRLDVVSTLQTHWNSILNTRKTKLDPLDLFDISSELADDERMVKESVARFVDEQVEVREVQVLGAEELPVTGAGILAIAAGSMLLAGIGLFSRKRSK